MPQTPEITQNTCLPFESILRHNHIGALPVDGHLLQSNLPDSVRILEHILDFDGIIAY